MSGLGIETAAFLKAFFSGMTVYGIYACIRIFRKIVPHNGVVVSIEDFIYWLFTGFYLFLKIFDASQGTIRWYFVAGTAMGVLFLSAGLSKTGKMCRKIHRKRQGKGGKGVD